MTFYRWFVGLYENVIRLSYVYADVESICRPQNILASKVIGALQLRLPVHLHVSAHLPP